MPVYLRRFPIMDSLSCNKNALREDLKNKRRLFIQKHGSKLLKSLNESLIVSFKNSIPIMPGSIIAGYWPLAEEVDCRPLLLHFHNSNYTCALPCVENPAEPLIFRKWVPSDPLELCNLFSNSLRLMQPSCQKEKLLPDIVLVPLLGFDPQGNRIGYGGGYYDATLHSLHSQKKVIAVGLAYSCQEIPSCFPEPHDEKLDYILTEQGIRSFIN